VICLTETRIKNEPLTKLKQTNYSFIHADSKTNAGGVAMYDLNTLEFELCQKQYQLTNSESIFISINNLTQPLIIGVIYRHPSSTSQDAFVEDLSFCLIDLNKPNLNYYLLGDYNINTSEVNRTPIGTQFLNALISGGAFPIITKLTRVTDSSATIIDHITTNDSKYLIRSDKTS